MQILLHKRSIYAFVLIVANLLFAGTALAAKFTSITSGNWNSTNTWNISGGTDGDGIPDDDDDVTITSGHTVTVNIAGNAAKITVNGVLNIDYNLVISDKGDIIVNSGGVLSFNNTAVISGGASGSDGIAILINNGATLKTANGYGFATSNAQDVTLSTGSFRVNIGNKTPIYSTLANYEYNGTSSQNTGNALTGANNLTISNSAGVSLTQNVNVSGILTLTQGQLTTTATNLLKLNDNATVTGASNASYVNGPIQKIGNDAFTFPVGKNGKYVPIAISAPANSTDAFTAEYFNSNPNASSPRDPSLNSVSGSEYWNLNRITGSSSVNVTLYWDVNKNNTSSNFFTTPALVTVAHHNGASWNKFGGSGVGSATAGSVTWNNVSDFSPFTFGTAINMSVLPVHFSNVKASEKASGVQVEFTNLTESDVDYYEVERSLDGKAFITTKKLYPSKNNYSSAAYSWLDAAAKEGKIIYRIKAVETTGKTIYSNLVNITLGAKNSSMSVYAKSGQVALQISNLPAGKYQLQLLSAAGQMLGVENISHGGGSLSQTTTLNSAKAGIYILNLSGAVRMQQKFLVQ